MSDLIDTTEMYLRTIYELREDGVVPMRARIAEQLGHAGPTVSQTIARMERDGLVHVNEDRHLELTPEGDTLAMRVMRKHRLAERLLTDVIGLELPFVHEEACRWEHVMSDRVERRVLELIDDPYLSPYGNPVPGLDELGVEPSGAAQRAESAVVDVAVSQEKVVSMVRIGETPQSTVSLLAQAHTIGLLPGTSVAVRRVEGGVELTSDRGSMVVSEDEGRHIFVGPQGDF